MSRLAIPIVAVQPDAAAAPGNVVPLEDAGRHCASCGVRTRCLPRDLPADAMDRFDGAVARHVRIRRRTSLYRQGEPFSALYAIRLGTFKTVIVSEDGHEQITGYHTPAEVIGVDGICDNRYGCDAIALEDSEVCVLPFRALDELAREVPALRANLYGVMSRKLCRSQNMMLLLGSRCAEERLVLFLLSLAERYHSLGYSGVEFVLRMTREEIASYLGLQLETVSRLFSHLQEDGLLQVQGRAVKLLDCPALRRRVGLH